MWITNGKEVLKTMFFLGERLINLKLKYEKGYTIIIGVYALAEGKEKETNLFYQTLQEIIDKYNKNYICLLYTSRCV